MGSGGRPDNGSAAGGATEFRRRGRKPVLEVGSEPVLGFRLRARLGAGAFAEVWDARARDGSAVALKFVDSRIKEGSLLRGEVRVLRALGEVGHPNVIKLFNVYASSHYLVLCMERADGNLEELRQAYREVTSRNVAPDHLLDLLQQAADGLDFLARVKLPGFNLASSGLQHCDVKPTNLLLMGEVVKIADFGLCAALGQQTHKHGWRGTLPYAAPELFYGRASPTTDQYALAVTYCDLVAGDRILTRAADVPTGRYAVPVNFSLVRARERPVLERALSPDPLRRWPSCRAFVDALREVALPPARESEVRRSGPRTSLGRQAPRSAAG
jgi:serine/threonine protein kinase